MEWFLKKYFRRFKKSVIVEMGKAKSFFPIIYNKLFKMGYLESNTSPKV